jgi:Uma2 family endonuclease
MAVQVRMTAEQLAELTDDRYKKSELVKGELIVMSPTGFEHGIVSARIAQILNDFVRARGLGYICGAETGFILQRNPDTVRAPDVAFVRKEKVSTLPTSFAEFAPDLAVEIVSPTDRSSEMEPKNLGVSCSRHAPRLGRLPHDKDGLRLWARACCPASFGE